MELHQAFEEARSEITICHPHNLLLTLKNCFSSGKLQASSWFVSGSQNTVIAILPDP
jgi:hypothetical protein